MNGAFHAPPLTVPSVFADGQSMRESPKKASRPFQFLEKKRSKIRKRAAKHFEGLAALSTHSAGRRSRPGVSPFISALTVARCPATFPGVWPQLRDTLSTSWSVGRGTGVFIYLLPFSENSPIFCSFPFTKIQLVFPPEQTGRMKHRTPFSPPATPAGITHYTLQAKSCAKWGRCPLWKPPQKKAVRYPSTGHIPPFLVIQPSGCIG